MAKLIGEPRSKLVYHREGSYVYNVTFDTTGGTYTVPFIAVVPESGIVPDYELEITGFCELLAEAVEELREARGSWDLLW